MHIPGLLTLSPPHTATWVGSSGRRYEFAVTRPGTRWIDSPAVYILTRREGHKVIPLFVGETESLQRRFGVSFERCPEEWGRAMALGMTHVHLRFEPRSAGARAAHVHDLAEGLHPLLSPEVQAVPAPAPAAVAAAELVNLPPTPVVATVPAVATPPAVATLPDPLPSIAEEAKATTVSSPPSLSLVADVPIEQIRVETTVRRRGLFGRILRLVRSPAEDHGAIVAAGDVLHGRSFEELPVYTPKAHVAAVDPAAVGLPDRSHSGAGTEGFEAGDQAAVEAPRLAVVALPPTAADGCEDAPATDRAVSDVTSGADEARVDVPAAAGEASPAAKAPAAREAVRAALAIDPAAPVVLFADELSHAAGADILLEAMLTVARDHAGVQTIFAGEGPLRPELEARAASEMAGRCRFIGHVAQDAFADVLAAADIVAIPARTPRQEGLAREALAAEKPLVITHHSRIGCVEHGRNGLVTYDNPGSFVWGIRELLGTLSRRQGPALPHAA